MCVCEVCAIRPSTSSGIANVKGCVSCVCVSYVHVCVSCVYASVCDVSGVYESVCNQPLDILVHCEGEEL